MRRRLDARGAARGRAPRALRLPLRAHPRAPDQGRASPAFALCAAPARALIQHALKITKTKTKTKQVFMDDVYRRQAVKSLLASCDTQPSGQFLFLTPQDMSSMLDQDTNQRHIFRMPDPRSD